MKNNFTELKRERKEKIKEGPIINALQKITLENLFFQRLNVIWETVSSDI